MVAQHYRIIGALSSLTNGVMHAGLDRFVGKKPSTYGVEFDFKRLEAHLQTKCKLIFLGEIHSVPAITEFQTKVIQSLTPAAREGPNNNNNNNNNNIIINHGHGDDGRGGTLHVVMEHFSFDMQELINDYCEGKLSFDEFVQTYHETGMEGHDLRPYQHLLEHIRSSSPRVRLHAGFISKRWARMLMKEGQERALKACKQWLPPELATLKPVTPFHYTFFSSLLTGRDIHAEDENDCNDGNDNVDDRFREIFQAQLLKDEAMAHKIDCVLRNDAKGKDDRVVVIAGNGHVGYYQGVPERVLAKHQDLIESTCLITCHSIASSASTDLPSETLLQDHLRVGRPGSNPADFVFVYHRDQ